MNGKGDTPRPVNGDRFRDNYDSIDWRRKPVKTQFMNKADWAIASASVYPGQLPAGAVGTFSVTERFDDGSEIIRSFADEDLAMQCSVKTGLPVEENQ